MTSQHPGQDDSTVAALLELTKLAAKVERVEHASAQRAEELARDCGTATQQINGLRGDLAEIVGRADEIDQRLSDIGAVVGQMTEQITAFASAGEQPPGKRQDYQVNPAPPWWRHWDERCQDTAARLADWVDEVYRPVFGYLGDLLAPCWQQHPLCLACLDTLHEAWCLLYIPPRDPKMVFAQLDWLTRPLLQAADIMATETRPCRDRGSHRAPGQHAANGLADRLSTR